MTGHRHVDYSRAEAWAGTRRSLAGARGLDPALYTDPAVHELELDRVFERAWVCIGLSAEAGGPGTVLVRQLGRRSILVTVDRDGNLNGFVNSCRHRGAELVDADCSVRGTIRCPYHRWGYALDGSLVSTPGFDQATKDGFDRDHSALAPVRVGRSGCLLFACLDPDTPPLDAWLGDLPQRLSGYDLGSWAASATMELDVAANWKLIPENFQDCYHRPRVHPDRAIVSRVEDHHRYQGPGMYCGQTTTPITGRRPSAWLGLPPRPGLGESDAVSGRHIAVFPNVILTILPNHAFVIRLQPDGPGSTRETCTWLLPPTADRRAEDDGGFAALRASWLEVNARDIDIVERSQRGLGNAMATPGPLVPRFEEPLHRFHMMLADHLTAQRPDEVRIPAGDRAGIGIDPVGRESPPPPAVERSAAGRRRPTRHPGEAT